MRSLVGGFKGSVGGRSSEWSRLARNSGEISHQLANGSLGTQGAEERLGDRRFVDGGKKRRTEE